MTDSIPEEFTKVMGDFLSDLKCVFPEYDNQYNTYYLANGLLRTDYLYSHVSKTYPTKFFDILYQNEELFALYDEANKTSENDTDETPTETPTETREKRTLYLLPDIDFIHLWNLENIGEDTRTKLWKYLQLITFSVIGNVQGVSGEEMFGDTARLFEAIDGDEFKDKLHSTIDEMGKMFDTMKGSMGSEINEDGSGNTYTDASGNETKNPFGANLPNPEELHDHISSLMDGKLGKLAKEIADETAKELDLDLNDAKSTGEVFNKMLKNPTKLMSIVKKVGGKLDEKLKSGDLKESELMEEASKMMGKMKNMPGMGNIDEMLKKMNIPGMGKNAKFNTSAFERKQQQSKQRERMVEKLRKRQEERAASDAAANQQTSTDTKKTMDEQLDELRKTFGDDLSLKAPSSTSNTQQNKKKKKKKK